MFLHFSFANKLMTSAYNRWWQHFFYLQPTLNRLLNNCIKLNWHWISSWNIKGEGSQNWTPQKKLPSKSPAALGLNSRDNPFTSTSPSDKVNSFFKVKKASLCVTFELLRMTESNCCCYEFLLTQIQKINVIAEFRLYIMLIQNRELLLAYAGVPDHIHMNGLNQIDAFIYVKLHVKEKLHTSATLEI